jgi:hypothetical protein
MSLLDHPEARALLDDAVLTPEAVRGCEGRLAAFLARYLPLFRRVEQRANATLVIRGLLGGLQRKTCEPIAAEAGVHRKPIQFLVGAGRWDDEAVMCIALGSLDGDLRLLTPPPVRHRPDHVGPDSGSGARDGRSATARCTSA